VSSSGSRSLLESMIVDPIAVLLRKGDLFLWYRIRLMMLLFFIDEFPTSASCFSICSNIFKLADISDFFFAVFSG